MSILDLDAVKKYTRQLNSYEDLEELVEQAGKAQIVLLGESSHGTSEFYKIRAEISKKLIQEKGFSLIAVEGDYPSCQEVNRYIKGYQTQPLNEVMEGFKRWPAWMWANSEMESFFKWLKEYNTSVPSNKKAGFYGLDVYSLWESMKEIIRYLQENNAPNLDLAKKAFACFEPHHQEAEKYAISAAFFGEDCLEEVTQLLTSIRLNAKRKSLPGEEALDLSINGLVVSNAEKYYRAMVQSDVKSWNIRDQHMAAALNEIRKFHSGQPKVIIWEHNTHVGDARATDMAKEGMVNTGQIIREQQGEDQVFIVGFGTYEGTVIAADGWGDPFEIKKVPPAQKGSWEETLHKAGSYDKWILFNQENSPYFRNVIDHRAIGVVYNPEYEGYGNYVPSDIAKRYNAFIYIDKSAALHPLAYGKTIKM